MGTVISEESDNMKLFLVLVLATVAICHPSRKGAAPANPSYNPVMDILADGEQRAVAVGGAKIVDVPETSFKNKKASRAARKHKVFLYDLKQYGLSGSAPVATVAIRPSRQLFGGKKAPAEPYNLEEILADTVMKILPGDKVEISFKELGNVRTARSGPKAPVAAEARRL